MSERTLIIALAQLLAAAAWADGALSPDEVDRLKELLRRLRDPNRRYEVEIADADWAQVEIYLRAPVTPEQRARLLQQLADALRGPGDRAFTLRALEDLLSADGEITPAERGLLDEVRTALESVDLGLLARLGRLIGGPLRVGKVGAPAADLDDFVRNRVFFLLRRRHGDLASLGVAEADLRRLSIAGSILALVARVDHQVGDGEIATISAALQRGGLPAGHADLVAEIAVSPEAADADFVRVTTGYLAITDEPERLALLDALFAVAAADGGVSSAELDEIRRVAAALKLTTRAVNDARDRALRGG